MTLTQLLDHAHVTTWDRATWFRGATLQPPYLCIGGDADDRAYVCRNFLPALVVILPGLEVRPLALARPTESRVWKKGYQPYQPPTQGDML
jgi:hypothetical protein